MKQTKKQSELIQRINGNLSEDLAEVLPTVEVVLPPSSALVNIPDQSEANTLVLENVSLPVTQQLEQTFKGFQKLKKTNNEALEIAQSTKERREEISLLLEKVNKLEEVQRNYSSLWGGAKYLGDSFLYGTGIFVGGKLLFPLLTWATGAAAIAAAPVGSFSMGAALIIETPQAVSGLATPTGEAVRGTAAVGIQVLGLGAVQIKDLALGALGTGYAQLLWRAVKPAVVRAVLKT